MYNEILKAKIREGLARTGLSPSRASEIAIGEKGAIGRIFSNHSPSFERACKILQILNVGMDFNLECLDAASEDLYYGAVNTDLQENAPAHRTEDQAPQERNTDLGGIPPGSLRDLENHTQGLVRVIATAGGDPIPPDLREKLIGLAVPPEPATATAEIIEFPVAATTDDDDLYQVAEGSPAYKSINDPTPDIPAARPVNVMEIAAAAGGGSEATSERRVGCVWFRRDWLDRHAIDSTQCAVISVQGHSMNPTLPPGCSILVDRRRRRRRAGRIFVLRTADGLIAKRLRHANGNWELLSDNPSPNWPTLPWPAGAEVVGEVVWAARTLLGEEEEYVEVAEQFEQTNQLTQQEPGWGGLKSATLRWLEDEEPDASKEGVEDFLNKKAQELEKVNAHIGKLSEFDNRFRNQTSVIQSALKEGDFDKAEKILDDAETQQTDKTLVEANKRAAIRRSRAEIKLLQGDVLAATKDIEMGATYLEPFDKHKAALYRHHAATRLCKHSDRFGGSGYAQAIKLYRINLNQWTREHEQYLWAETQNNLGNAYSSLGEREDNTEHLMKAVVAYKDALEEHTRAGAPPLYLAEIQNNLGYAYLGLGERESNTEHLGNAVAVFTAALEEHTRECVPLDWAATQTNLGHAYSSLGKLKGNTEHLGNAVAAYKEALEEHTRESAPLEWADTQHNLGSIYWELNKLEDNTEHLENAVDALTMALEEYTRTRVPHLCTETRVGLRIACMVMDEREGNAKLLKRAEAACAAVPTVMGNNGNQSSYPLETTEPSLETHRERRVNAPLGRSLRSSKARGANWSRGAITR